MQNMNRRDFMKMTGAAAAGFALSQVLGLGKTSAQAPVVGSQYVPAGSGHGSCAKVYFTEHIDAAHLIKLYDIINESIYGKVAIKLHTGEPYGPNILGGGGFWVFKLVVLSELQASFGWFFGFSRELSSNRTRIYRGCRLRQTWCGCLFSDG